MDSFTMKYFFKETPKKRKRKSSTSKLKTIKKRKVANTSLNVTPSHLTPSEKFNLSLDKAQTALAKFASPVS